MRSLLLPLLLVACSTPAPAPLAPPAKSEPTTTPSVTPTTTTMVSAAPTAPTATAAAAPGPPKPPPPLPKGTVVLHVGDSMADALGKSLKREFSALGIKNILKAKESTYIPGWAGHKHQFRALVAGHKPDLVIITLGGNEVAMPDPSVRAEPVKKIVQAVGDRPCIWIAAPLWKNAPNTGILQVIEKNCAPCIFVDTNKLVTNMKRTGDKVHPTIPERRRWAKYMIRWLRHNRDPKGSKPWSFKKTTVSPKEDPAVVAAAKAKR